MDEKKLQRSMMKEPENGGCLKTHKLFASGAVVTKSATLDKQIRTGKYNDLKPHIKFPADSILEVSITFRLLPSCFLGLFSLSTFLQQQPIKNMRILISTENSRIRKDKSRKQASASGSDQYYTSTGGNISSHQSFH